MAKVSQDPCLWRRRLDPNPPVLDPKGAEGWIQWYDNPPAGLGAGGVGWIPIPLRNYRIRQFLGHIIRFWPPAGLRVCYPPVFDRKKTRLETPSPT